MGSNRKKAERKKWNESGKTEFVWLHIKWAAIVRHRKFKQKKIYKKERHLHATLFSPQTVHHTIRRRRRLPFIFNNNNESDCNGNLLTYICIHKHIQTQHSWICSWRKTSHPSCTRNIRLAYEIFFGLFLVCFFFILRSLRHIQPMDA